MRLWMWLLVLLNVGLLVYFNMDTLAPKAQVVRTEVNPEKLKLLLDEDFANLTKKEYTSPSTANSCYKWGKFTTASLPAAQEVIANLGLAADIVEEILRIYGFDKIERLGVEELYIVQDSQWRNAISFGLVSEEPLANALLKELKAKGVRNAVKSLRSQGAASTSLLAKDVTSEVAVELYKVRPEFVGTEVRPVPCP